MLAPGSVKPFVKWTGGKQKMVGRLMPYLPVYQKYHEPFMGGAALFFHVQPRRAVLTDLNAELVNAFQVVRDDVEHVLEELRVYQQRHSAEHYREIRALTPRSMYSFARAARFIYLNKTCFNGLYRVNRQNQFNVPMGSYVNPRICDEATIRAASAALQWTNIFCASYQETFAFAGAGDFFYVDPPYDSAFNGYTADGTFNQQRLAETLWRAANNNVTWMLSNSDTPQIRSLYSAFRIVELSRQGTMCSDPTKRQSVRELLIMNY